MSPIGGVVAAATTEAKIAPAANMQPFMMDDTLAPNSAEEECTRHKKGRSNPRERFVHVVGCCCRSARMQGPISRASELSIIRLKIASGRAWLFKAELVCAPGE